MSDRLLCIQKSKNYEKKTKQYKSRMVTYFEFNTSSFTIV